MRSLLPLFSWFLAFLAAGCGADAPQGNSGPEVTGTVTWNGASLPEGDILFVAVDGRSVPGAGKIKNGQFTLRTSPGEKRVEILATRKGKFDPVMNAHTQENFIPACYNTASTLTATVKEDGENRFSFNLRENP